MISSKDRKFSSVALLGKQRGGALILIAFMIGIMLTAFLIKNFSANSIKAEQDAKTMEALGQAKEALIAWAVSYRDLPGLMPYPNRGTDAAGYEDGGADCFAASTLFNYAFLIGMFPTKDSNDTNCISLTRKGFPEFAVVNNPLSPQLVDVTGNPLWYAVSRNLVRNYESPAVNPVINPGMLNVDLLKQVPYDGTEATSPYPWLIVRDATGAVISDRVAAVIIAPSVPLAGQNRTNSATSAHFLDQVTVDAITYSNRDYDQPDEDFIIGDTTTGTFNDRLTYITIDELMAALERRAAMTAKDALIDYASVNGGFPSAAPIGITKGYSCDGSSNAGLLPLDAAPTCTFSFTVSTGTAAPSWWPSWLPWFPNPTWGVDEYAVSSSCSFEAVERTIFTRTSGVNYTSATQNCELNGLSCTCNGAGSCSGPNVPTFTCDASGSCNSAIHIRNVNSEIDFEGGYFSGATGACSTAVPACETGRGYPVQCSAGNVDTTGTFFSACSEPPLTGLPNWFRENKWQDYIYYVASPTPTPGMTVGDRTGVQALLATTGRALNAEPFAASKGGLAPQTRLSCDVTDYLDSMRNVTGIPFYEATNKPRTLNYNDQLFIVSP